MKREDQLQSLFNLLMDSKNEICLIEYGSRKEHSDIDLLMITNKQYATSDLNFDRIDLRIIHYNSLVEHLRYNDVLYTEPIITGNFIFGNKNIFEEIFQDINNNHPKNIIVAYLLYNSTTLLLDSISAIHKETLTNKAVATNLSYALSYFYFSKWYQTHESIIECKKLRSEYDDYSFLWEKYKALKEDYQKEDLIKYFEILSIKIMGL